MRRDIAARFVVIWTLLTRIPLPQKWWPETMPPGNRVLTLAPAAGGLMGLLTGLVVTIAGFFGLAPLACAWAGAAFYFVIGWALHLDGWGDVWDGIGSGRSGCSGSLGEVSTQAASAVKTDSKSTRAMNIAFFFMSIF